MCKGIKDLFFILYRNHLPHLPPLSIKTAFRCTITLPYFSITLPYCAILVRY